MNTKDFERWGIPKGDATRLTIQTIKRLINEGVPHETVRSGLLDVVHDPELQLDHSHWSELAKMLFEKGDFCPRESPAPWKQWGKDLEENAVQQMRNACELPVSHRGALMPDAHTGYGLPIGGVLAVDNAIIPYAVGVDIACRMKLTVLDLPVSELDNDVGRERLSKAIQSETRFGVGAGFKGSRLRRHNVMDQDWSVTPVTKQNKDKAWKQLGTSGSGNHFVEFGELEILSDSLDVPQGRYLALLSHSGSRGTGASIASHYSKLAKNIHEELPQQLKHLAWLDMESEEGLEYWHAMNLMGDYAAGNHACIHEYIARHLGVQVLLDIENHHNFAWKEEHDGKDYYVHRKGATPAGKGVVGIIPGSMASPAYIVEGKGNPESLNSASHGAGRVMSRTKAKQNLKWEDAQKLLDEKRVTLMSAGLDEVPMVYKNIDDVMDAQKDLVDIKARFHPRLVKMAPAGERAED